MQGQAREQVIQEFSESQLLHAVLIELQDGRASVSAAQRSVALVGSFHQHGCRRQANAKTESLEGLSRTCEYSIGDACNQHITQDKPEDNDLAALSAVALDDPACDARHSSG